MRAIFVSSLGHSGSTLLERVLCTNPGVVGLGEVHQLLTSYPHAADLERHPCGCGQAVASCPFWSDLLARLDPDHRELAGRYRTLTDCFTEHFGSDAVMVDSSKRIAALEGLLAAGATVDVVDLTRDVRSWSVAMRERSRRAATDSSIPAVPGARYIRRKLADTPLGLFRTWQRMNSDRKASLVTLAAGRERDLPNLASIDAAVVDAAVVDAAVVDAAVVDSHGQIGSVVEVGYEPLAANTATTQARIFGELGLAVPQSGPRLELGNVVAHTVYGNNMKLSPVLRESISMDLRWLRERYWILPFLFMPSVAEDNSRWVYANEVPLPFGR